MASVKNTAGDIVSKVKDQTSQTYGWTKWKVGAGKISADSDEFKQLLECTDDSLDFLYSICRMVQQMLFSDIDTSGRETEIAMAIDKWAEKDEPAAAEQLKQISEKLSLMQDVKDKMSDYLASSNQEEEINEEVVIPLEVLTQIDAAKLPGLKKRFGQWKMMYDSRLKGIANAEKRGTISDVKLQMMRKQLADTEASFGSSTQDLTDKCTELVDYRRENLVTMMMKILRAKLDYHQSCMEMLLELDSLIDE